MTTSRTVAPTPRATFTPPPAPAAKNGAASYLPRQLSGLSRAVRSGFEGTPGRLKGIGALTVAVTLLFGLLAGYSVRSADGALTRAEANADQLVRVQAIQTRVVQADADATNAFLVGGLEPPAERAEYTAAITSASRLVAEAACSQPADGAALGVVNQALVTYASEIEQARANNRQALPIGAQYLKNASAGLRAEALPALESLVAANDQRVATEFDRAGHAVWWLIVSGLVTLGVLVWALVWLARRTRRYVNLPLAAAAVIVLLALLGGTAGLVSVGAQAKEIQNGVYGATVSTAQARIAGFDAKSNESLALIARGSGGSFEEAWKTSDGVVRTEIDKLAGNSAAGDTTLPWAAYASVHEQIRKLDDSGDWDGAVRLATGTAADTGNATFTSFDESSGEQLSSLSKKTSAQLDQAGGWLSLASILGLLAGLGAALCAWWGVALRLEEYR